MKYICELCGWIYDEDKGDPNINIKPEINVFFIFLFIN